MSTPVVVVSGAGTPGPRGNGWLSGTGAPSNSVGLDGDFYLDTANAGIYYGPKSAGLWPGSPAYFSSKTNTTATTNPTVNSDNTAGYAVGSVWVNTTSSTYFVCSSASTGAAVWTPVLPVGTAANTVAAGNDSRITGAAQKASNLNDLSSSSAARTNLGLGGAATLNVGTATGTVAAGDDSRITGAVQSTTLPNARASFAPHRRQPQWRQPSTIITTFQAGHGWTNNAGSTFVANDTSDFILGTQACKLTSGGTGASANLSKTGMPTIDTTGKVIRLRIKIDDITHMTGFNFFLGSSSLANNYKWIIQGGPAGSNFVESGNWYIVTLNWHDATITGSPTRSGITDARLQIVDDATATVTLHANSVELVNDASATFPNGVVSVTFDDSYQSVWDFGMPKLASYGYQASVYTIHDMIGTAGRFTFAELGYLQGLHGWECGSHANTDVDHSLTYTGLTSAQLDDDLANLKSWGLVSGFRGSSGTAYPLGQYGKTTDAVDTTSIVQKYFDYARTTNSKTKETFPPADPFRLRAISSISTFAGSYPPSNLTAVNGDLDKAKANQTWLILVFHKIVTGTPAAATEIAQSDFNTIIDGINSRGMPVLTIGDVMRYSNSI